MRMLLMWLAILNVFAGLFGTNGFLICFGMVVLIYLWITDPGPSDGEEDLA
jgi:hypothetical protein